MPSLADRANQFSSTGTGFEFNQFFTKRKVQIKGKEKVIFSLKKAALKEVDTLYFTLPKAIKAIDIVAKTTVNNGVLIDSGSGRSGKVTDADKAVVQEFIDSLLPNQLEFFWDLIRLHRSKGNMFLTLSKKFLLDKNGNETKQFKYVWVQIEPEKIGVIANTEDDTLGKYDIRGYVIIKPNSVIPLDHNLTLFVKSSPGSIMGVPPLLANHLYSKAIVAEIKKYFQTQASGMFKKTMLNPKKITGYQNGLPIYQKLDEPSRAAFVNEIQNLQTDPNKANYVGDVEVTKTPLDVVEADPDFPKKYDGSFTQHTASLTGVPAYRLMDPESINRATAEEQYKEFIEELIQPLNNTLSRIAQAMFEVWHLTVKNSESKIKITMDNPKPALDVVLTGKDLAAMESSKQITTNELRHRIGLKDYTEEELQLRENQRQAENKKPANSNPEPQNN